MNLIKFPWVATLVLYLVSSGFFPAASNEEEPLMDNLTRPIMSSSNASSLLQQDQLIEQLMHERDEALKKVQEAESRALKQAQALELMKQRDEALKKVQDAETTTAQQAQKIEEMTARLNKPVKPQPTPQVSSASPNKASASTTRQASATPVPRQQLASSTNPRPQRTVGVVTQEPKKIQSKTTRPRNPTTEIPTNRADSDFIKDLDPCGCPGWFKSYNEECCKCDSGPNSRMGDSSVACLCFPCWVGGNVLAGAWMITKMMIAGCYYCGKGVCLCGKKAVTPCKGCCEKSETDVLSDVLVDDKLLALNK